MSAEDLRAKSVDELVKIIIDLRKEQFNARHLKTQRKFAKTAAKSREQKPF